MLSTILTLTTMGYSITNAYADAVVRMERTDEGVFTFVDADGSVSRAKTWDTAVATIEFHNAGLEVH